MTLREAWCKETAHSSYQKDWSEDNPSCGQCVVTALIMQEILGGDIYECTVNRKKHFYNVTPDGRTYDFTQEQFDGAFIIYNNIKKRTRESLLKVANVRERYELLKSRMEEK